MTSKQNSDFAPIKKSNLVSAGSHDSGREGPEEEEEEEEEEGLYLRLATRKRVQINKSKRRRASLT